MCIFAYGQTGSGKTYTMEGGPDGEDTQGMIPRAVTQIFTTARELEDKGWTVRKIERGGWEEGVLVGSLLALVTQQHASLSQGRFCSDYCTCCHTEIEVADQTFYLTQF